MLYQQKCICEARCNNCLCVNSQQNIHIKQDEERERGTAENKYKQNIWKKNTANNNISIRISDEVHWNKKKHKDTNTHTHTYKKSAHIWLNNCVEHVLQAKYLCVEKESKKKKKESLRKRERIREKWKLKLDLPKSLTTASRC